MSIWASVGEPVRGLNGHTDDANYRAEGEPTAGVDVAVTAYHDHVRLSVWDDTEAAEMEVILSPAAARTVRDQLDQAAGGGAVTEYGVLMSAGGYRLRWDNPDAERIYPLAQWIGHQRRTGATVARRRVIVVEDWAEVDEP